MTNNDVELMAKLRNIVQMNEGGFPISSLPKLKGIGSQLSNVGKKIAQSYKSLPTAGKAAIGAGAGMAATGAMMGGDSSNQQMSGQSLNQNSVAKKSTRNVRKGGLTDMEEMELNVLSVDMEKALDQPEVKAELERYYKYHPDVKRAF